LLQRLCLVSAPCCCVSTLFQSPKYPAPVPNRHPSSSESSLSCRIVSLLMSHLIQSGQRAPSPGAGNFASNNPFRRAASPLPSPDHRMSNNPFLDPPAPQRQAPSNSFTEDIFVRVASCLLPAPPSSNSTSLLIHVARNFNTASTNSPPFLSIRIQGNSS
jgi:hypothetical protein